MKSTRARTVMGAAWNSRACRWGRGGKTVSAGRNQTPEEARIAELRLTAAGASRRSAPPLKLTLGRSITSKRIKLSGSTGRRENTETFWIAHTELRVTILSWSFAAVSILALIACPEIEAQPSVKIHHIGFLAAGDSPAHRQQLETLREGLRDLGYVEGESIVITALWSKTGGDLPELAASLVKQDVKLIVAPSTPAVVALRPLTQTIPIVFALAADPVSSGLVASLARPGGNITGLSQLNTELSGKRVELLREASGIRRAVVLWFAPDDGQATDTLTAILRETERRGRALGIDLRLLKVPGWKISRQRSVVSPGKTGPHRPAYHAGIRPCGYAGRLSAKTPPPGGQLHPRS
jgi:hypothetical protein